MLGKTTDSNDLFLNFSVYSPDVASMHYPVRSDIIGSTEGLGCWQLTAQAIPPVFLILWLSSDKAVK